MDKGIDSWIGIGYGYVYVCIYICIYIYTLVSIYESYIFFEKYNLQIVTLMQIGLFLHCCGFKMYLFIK